MSEVLAFLGISAVVIVTPGQDTALTIRNTLAGGKANGVSTAFGVASGQATWTLAATSGVTALLFASEPLFEGLKLAGAMYLLYLGVHGLYAAISGRSLDASGGKRRTGLTASSCFRQGLLSNLGNPKMAVFFASLLPQFVTEDTPTALLSYGAVFCSMTLVWLSSYALIVARIGDVLRRPSVRRGLEGAMGVVLITLGVRLAAEHR